MKNEKLNILFDYPQQPYAESKKGNFIHSYFLAKNLSKKANLYSIGLRNNPKKIKNETGVMGTNIFIKKAPAFINSWIQLLILILKREKISLVYSRYTASLKQGGAIYSMLFSVPIIYELGGIPWEEFPSLIFSSKLYMKLILFPLRRANTIICYSDSIKNELLKKMKYDEEKIKIISCGVDENIFTQKNKVILRKKYNFQLNKKIITFGGAITKWQGLDMLITVAKKISKENKNFIFLIAGGGSYLKNIVNTVEKENLKKYFYFTDYILQSKMVDYINLADFCIAPFVEERKASPIKIFEYLTCGKCALVSKIPDVCDLGLDDSLIYATPGDAQSFTKQITKLIKDEKFMKQKEKRSRAMILKDYTWEKLVEKVYKNIADIIKTL